MVFTLVTMSSNVTNSTGNFTAVASVLGSIRFPNLFFAWNIILWGVMAVYMAFSSRWFAALVAFLVNKLYLRGTAGAYPLRCWPTTLRVAFWQCERDGRCKSRCCCGSAAPRVVRDVGHLKLLRAAALSPACHLRVARDFNM